MRVLVSCVLTGKMLLRETSVFVVEGGSNTVP